MLRRRSSGPCASLAWGATIDVMRRVASWSMPRSSSSVKPCASQDRLHLRGGPLLEATSHPGMPPARHACCCCKHPQLLCNKGGPQENVTLPREAYCTARRQHILPLSPVPSKPTT